MARGLSLANKTLLLFGVAVVLSVAASMVIPWIRVLSIVDAGQLETSRQIARLYAAGVVVDPAYSRWLAADHAQIAELSDEISIRSFSTEQWRNRPFDAPGEAFERAAQQRLLAAGDDAADQPRGGDEQGDDEIVAEVSEALWVDGGRRYSIARIIEDEQGQPIGVVTVSRTSVQAAGQVLINRLLLVVAGLAVSLFAVGLFYVIMRRIVLRPVLHLRDTAELVRAGNLAVRSDIETGDEFEQLAETFNAMLEAIAAQQSQLRAVNKSLDLKLTELAERNVALFEAARLKGEFLASVSHELRTPLNSIIGFAEILRDIARSEEAAEPDPKKSQRLRKRLRYSENIVSAGRSLLEMINELLTMAKIEAGRVELNLQPMNVPETCDGLLALIRPLAERKQIDLRLVYGADAGAGGSKLPLVTTDATKLQQVVFNFLSNAVKFTPEGGRVTLRAEKLASADGQDRVRLSVIDTGPGIPEDQQDAVFEKFRQLDSGLARAHTGTGLGLAIAKEFAEMLGAEIQLVSAPAQGSTFSVILPIEPAVERLTKPAEPEELALEILAGGDAAPAPTPTSDATAEPRSDAAD